MGKQLKEAKSHSELGPSRRYRVTTATHSAAKTLELHYNINICFFRRPASRVRALEVCATGATRRDTLAWRHKVTACRSDGMP